MSEGASGIGETLTAADCLIAIMVAISASDERLPTTELVTIERLVNHLPVFQGYDQSRIPEVSGLIFDLFSQEDGLDALFALLGEHLPARLKETAYALACDVAAADGALYENEIRLLLAIRDELGIDRLHAAAIERGARVRHMT